MVKLIGDLVIPCGFPGADEMVGIVCFQIRQWELGAESDRSNFGGFFSRQINFIMLFYADVSRDPNEG